MILCLAKPPEEYVVNIDGEEYGLWLSYGGDIDMFSLMSRIVPGFFMYEPGFEDYPQDRVIGEMSNAWEYKETLDQEINGVSVRTILHTHSPEKMLDLFASEDVSHLQCVPGATQGLLTCMAARVLQFRKHYRGNLSKSGNIHTLQFRSSLTEQEDQLLLDYIKIVKTMMRKHL